MYPDNYYNPIYLGTYKTKEQIDAEIKQLCKKKN